MNTVASLPDRLAMHARDCAKAADMDTDVVLSREQIDAMADDMAEAALALATPEQPGFRMTSDEGGWTKEDALRYIENWCPDYVKDYICSLEQPGSAVQGEAKPIAWIEQSVHDDLIADKPWTAGANNVFCQRKVGEYTVPLYTTPPPAPAAEQVEQRSTHRVHRGAEWLPCYCASTTDHLIGSESAQPEARGVEGMAVAWMGQQKNGLSYGPLHWTRAEVLASPTFDPEIDEAIPLFATPNPVRAEQPCTCPQHPDDVIPCPRHRAEQPEGKGAWPKNLLVLGAPIHAVYVPPGYAIDGVAMRDERVLRFVAAAPAAPVVDDAWKNAVLNALAGTGMDAPHDEPPHSILNRIIRWHEEAATDPAISGVSAPVGVEERVRGIIALLRRTEPDNGEKYTEHDAGYDQASREIADMLECALTPPAAAPRVENCVWTLDDDEDCAWRSTRGEYWTFIDGTPEDNNCRFCHSCGKPVSIAALAGKAQEESK